MKKHPIQPIGFNFIVKSALSSRLRLKVILLKVFVDEHCSLERLDYIFCSDEYLLNINREFLKHDLYTDIITFNLAENNRPICGEIYISVDRVKENARKFTTSIQKEFERVIIHGALHLCGFKDKTPSQKLQMKAKEDYYLSLM